MVIQIAGFTVVGIATRTSNAREMTPDGVIAAQWQRWTSEGLAARIPGKLDTSTVALYTDYTSDHNGHYTFVLGAKVNPGSTVPEGLVAAAVPAGPYAVLATDQGPVSRVVVATWQRIGSMSRADLGGERAYRTDFEVYGERAADPANAQVSIYVGVR